MASLSLQHINKTYPNGFEAVKDFNLEIEDKEFIIFVGPSGCGKSTTLRMIAGLEEITSGTLKIGDRVVNDVEPKDRDIAMVFQNYALYPQSILAVPLPPGRIILVRLSGPGRPRKLPLKRLFTARAWGSPPFIAAFGNTGWRWEKKEGNNGERKNQLSKGTPFDS